MGALAGFGVGGALVGMDIPEYEAKRYEGRIKEDGILLSVHCDTSEEIKRAKELLKSTGAEDIWGIKHRLFRYNHRRTPGVATFGDAAGASSPHRLFPIQVRAAVHLPHQRFQDPQVQRAVVMKNITQCGRGCPGHHSPPCR
jgi:hypothetical protein